MPNERYHPMHDKIKAKDSANGAHGTGKVVDIKKTYGNSIKFGTKYSDEADQGVVLGKKGRLGSK